MITYEDYNYYIDEILKDGKVDNNPIDNCYLTKNLIELFLMELRIIVKCYSLMKALNIYNLKFKM